MATTFKEKLFTGRTVEFTSLTMKHFDLFLETLNQKKSLLTFYIELLIDYDVLVAVETSEGTMSKEEKDKLNLLPCEVYEIMFHVRLKSIGNELAISHEWIKGKPTVHRFNLSEKQTVLIETKLPSEKETLEVELSGGRVVMIQKGTIGQLRKHNHNIKKGNASEMIAMHNPKEKRSKDGAETLPISLSISELKKLSWSDSPKLMKLCGEANGSYSLSVEITNPQDKTEIQKVDLLSFEGFAAFFGLEDSLV